jgi:hypothetical protein
MYELFTHHLDTLKVLRLKSGNWAEPENAVYERLAIGFEFFEVLETLSTDWHLLMGRPSGRDHPGEGGWQYPHMSDMLPANVENLLLFIDKTMVSHNYEDVYTHLLANAANDLPLKSVCLEGRNLPFNIPLMRQAYTERGVQLNIRLPDDTDLRIWWVYTELVSFA